MGFFDDLIEGLADDMRGNIENNVTNMFTALNNETAKIAVDVGESPSAWNGGSVFSMIENLSDSLIVPIAGIILTFVMCYELIQMIIDRNNMHDFESFIFFKWIFKTAISVLIITHTWDIVMGVFDVAQSVIVAAPAKLYGGTNPTLSIDYANLTSELNNMGFWDLFGLQFQTMILQLGIQAISIVVFLILNARMIEIYLTVSLAPIPLATMANKEVGQMGHNYIKALIAIAFQGFLIVVCVAIYATLVTTSINSTDIASGLWKAMGYAVLLAFMLMKTGSISKSIFGSH